MKCLSFFSKYEENFQNMELSTLVLEVSICHFLNSFQSKLEEDRRQHLGFMFENLKSFGLGKTSKFSISNNSVMEDSNNISNTRVHFGLVNYSLYVLLGQYFFFTNEFQSALKVHPNY